MPYHDDQPRRIFGRGNRHGLIKQDRDTLRLIYAIPTGEIPVQFNTKEKQLKFVMRKIE